MTAALKDGILVPLAGEWQHGFQVKDKALIYTFKMQKVIHEYANVAIKCLLNFEE